jgi:hypothetical protein
VIAPSTVPRRAERIAARVVDGRALIVVLDQKALHALNGVGTRVWELCDGRSIAAIADALAVEYEVGASTALADVQRFVGELCAKGALTLSVAPGSHETEAPA